MERPDVDTALSSKSAGFDYQPRSARATARLQGGRTRVCRERRRLARTVLMAESISNPEYAAVRDGGAGVIDLSSRGRILVSGSEAVMFLNGLVTNDMKSLALNSWMPAAFANVQGRLLAAVRIIHYEDGFLVETEESTHEAVMKLVERFTLAGDFKVADLTDETAELSAQGNAACDIVAKVLGTQAAELERQKSVTCEHHGDAV